MAEEKNKGLTWPQLRYWLSCVGLIVFGILATVWGGPWSVIHPFVKELGPAIFIAGILASLVEPYFRKEFARDAFVASFRYVLPEEFKDEIGKILRNVFIAEDQIWRVEIRKTDNDDIVAVTTSFERTIKNKTSQTQKNLASIRCQNFTFQTEILK